MFGAGDDDDGDFATVPSGSTLASLFAGGGGGGTAAAVDASSKSNSFQFHAPKQPRKGQHGAAAGPQKPPADAPAVMSTAVVQTYMYVNGQYVSRGKLGLALLGNPDAKDYKLLLYGQQRKTVTSAQVHGAFLFSVQANNYASFYDDQRQNWSIMFDNEQVASDFSTQVCLAKWQVTGGAQPGKSVLQDLRPGEGQAVESGDSLEVEYTGWILQPGGSLGEVFDSNVGKEKMMRLKLGKGKVIKGWEQGMLGMCKGGRRLLLVPPSLAYGAQGLPPRIPPGCPLAFRVEIKRVKFARDATGAALEPRDAHSPSPVPSQGGTPPLQPAVPTLTAPQTVPPIPGSEESVKSRSHSLSEQLTSPPDSAKARLISRMARMGQPLLLPPAGGAAHGDTSDSELEEGGGVPVGPPIGGMQTLEPQTRSAPSNPPVNPPHIEHPHTITEPVSVKQPVPAFRTLAPSQTAQQQHPQHQQQALALPLTQPYQVWPDSGFLYGQVPSVAAPAYSAPFPGGGDVATASFLMADVRQHNAELRLSVGRVSDRIEQLHSKVDDIHRQNVSHGLPQAALASVNLDAAMIMQNITRILQENERLKQELLERSGRLEQQNQKISDLLQRNQSYAEQSNLLLEQRNDSFKSSTEQSHGRVLALEQDKARLTEALAQVTAQLTGAQSQLSANQTQEREVKGQLEVARAEAEARGAEVASLGEQLSGVREELRRCQEASRAERAALHAARLRAEALEEEVAELRAVRAALETAALERRRRTEEQLLALREQLRGAPRAEELSALRAELEERSAASLRGVQAEKDAVQLHLSRVQAELAALGERAAGPEAADARLWQEKYAALRLKATEMRREFEARLARAGTVPRGPADTDTLTEVKNAMNAVFRALRSEFTLEGTYSGRMILATVVNTIKATTLSLVSASHSPGETGAAGPAGSPAAGGPEPETPVPAPAPPRGPANSGSSPPPEGAAAPPADLNPAPLPDRETVTGVGAGEEEEEEDEEEMVMEVVVETVEVLPGKALDEAAVDEAAPPPPAELDRRRTGRDRDSGNSAEAGADRPAAERKCVPGVMVTTAGEASAAPEQPTELSGKPRQPPSSAGDDEEEEKKDDEEEEKDDEEEEEKDEEDGNLLLFVAPDKKISRDDSGSPIDKPGPPPLFGDDDDEDDDVDWLK